MNDRDKRIIQSLIDFSCMTSSQLAKMHCSNNKKPKATINRIMKRLSDRNLVEVDKSNPFSDYIYFPADSNIKKNSQKIPHHLSIVDTFLEMNEYDPIKDYKVEEKLIGGDGFRPDLYCIWLEKPFCVEVQRSLYTTSNLKSKIDAYSRYKESGKWKGLNIDRFPNLLIVGKAVDFDKEDYDFPIEIVSSIDKLKPAIDHYKASKLERIRKEAKGVKPLRKANMESEDLRTNVSKSNNGKITFKLN